MMWHVMDTAPQDGTPILAHDGSVMAVVKWDCGCFYEGGGQWLIAVADGAEAVMEAPIRWMPLPAR